MATFFILMPYNFLNDIINFLLINLFLLKKVIIFAKNKNDLEFFMKLEIFIKKCKM